MNIKFKFDDNDLIKHVDKAEEDMPNKLIRNLKLASIHLVDQVGISLTTGEYGVKTREGRLKNSFDYKLFVRKNKGNVVSKVGSNLIYARIQNDGGKINVSTRMAKFAWWKFKETKQLMWKAIALKKGRQITIKKSEYFTKTVEEATPMIFSLLQKDLITL